jgi:hypothetical protein
MERDEVLTTIITTKRRQEEGGKAGGRKEKQTKISLLLWQAYTLQIIYIISKISDESVDSREY